MEKVQFKKLDKKIESLFAELDSNNNISKKDIITLKSYFLRLISYGYRISFSSYNKDNISYPNSLPSCIKKEEFDDCVLIAKIYFYTHDINQNVNFHIPGFMTIDPSLTKYIPNGKAKISFDNLNQEISDWLNKALLECVNINKFNSAFDRKIKHLKEKKPLSSKDRLIKSLTWRVRSSNFSKEDLLELLKLIKKYDINKIRTILGISDLSGFKYFDENIIEEAVDRALIQDILE